MFISRVSPSGARGVAGTASAIPRCSGTFLSKQRDDTALKEDGRTQVLGAGDKACFGAGRGEAFLALPAWEAEPRVLSSARTAL